MKITTITTITIFSVALSLWNTPTIAQEEAEGLHVVEITAPELRKLLKEDWVADDRPVFIDLRNAEEHAKGHLTNARQLEFPSETFEAKLSKFDRNRAYLVYCQDGENSSESLAIWERLRFTKLYYLKGGWHDYLSLISGR